MCEGRIQPNLAHYFFVFSCFVIYLKMRRIDRGHQPGGQLPRRSSRLIVQSLPPHRRVDVESGRVTAPTHVNDIGQRNRGRPPPQRRSLRIFLLSLPPHRRDEFQRRRGWYEMTALELVESIRMPRREHWEDHCQYDFAGIQQRRWEQDHARAAIQHLYASDNDSATRVINDGGGERNSSEDEGSSTNAYVNNNNNGEDGASQHDNSTNHDDNELEDENMDVPDDDAGIRVSYQM